VRLGRYPMRRLAWRDAATGAVGYAVIRIDELLPGVRTESLIIDDVVEMDISVRSVGPGDGGLGVIVTAHEVS